MEEETWKTRIASGVEPEETTRWEQVAPRQSDGADCVILGNDDAIRSCGLVARFIADAIEAARGKVTAEEPAATAAGSERPAPDVEEEGS